MCATGDVVVVVGDFNTTLGTPEADVLLSMGYEVAGARGGGEEWPTWDPEINPNIAMQRYFCFRIWFWSDKVRTHSEGVLALSERRRLSLRWPTKRVRKSDRVSALLYI